MFRAGRRDYAGQAKPRIEGIAAQQCIAQAMDLVAKTELFKRLVIGEVQAPVSPKVSAPSKRVNKTWIGRQVMMGPRGQARGRGPRTFTAMPYQLPSC